jgi:hypothetical protein
LVINNNNNFINKIFRYKKAAIQGDHILATGNLYHIYNCSKNFEWMKIKRDVNQSLYWIKNCRTYQEIQKYEIKSYVLFP